SYKPSAFDAANLAYPDSKWTLDDFANAARKLATKDASGAVTSGSIFVTNEGALLQSLIGTSLFDSSTVPDTLHFDNPTAEKVLDTWHKLNNENLLSHTSNTAPINIVPAELLSLGGATNKEKPGVAALPGGQIGLDAEGFAISAGTLHPDEAYQLV